MRLCFAGLFFAGYNKAMDIVYIIAGLVLLFAGGEGLVKGSVALAEKMGVSTLLVSLIVVGFGTSAPELLVCVKAALSGTADLAVGNVIGSNIANTLLIIGVGAVITPLICQNTAIRRDALSVILASILVAALALNGALNVASGGLLLVVLFGYLGWSYISEKKAAGAEQRREAAMQEAIVEAVDAPPTQVWKAALFTVFGLGALVLGAEWLVNGASSVARSYGVSDVIIGLTLVALGTSLPELATAISASIKGHSDVIIGNVLGSNLFNILGILGTTAVITPLSMGGRVIEVDIWIMLCSAVILYPAILSGRNISRVEGGFFLLLYSAYIASMFL